MIKDSTRYYGSAILTLLDASVAPIQMCRLQVDAPGFYCVEGKLPIYLKYATSRKGPWVFNFQKSHQEIENSLFSQYGECITALICGKDGIVALRHYDLREILDEIFDDQESVVIRRRHNEMYRVNGRNGCLSKKVSQASFERIFKDFMGIL